MRSASSFSTFGEDDGGPRAYLPTCVILLRARTTNLLGAGFTRFDNIRKSDVVGGASVLGRCEHSRNMEYTASCCFTTIDGMPTNAATSERVLVARCKAGDHSAFMELIRRSSSAALRAIRNIARNPADVDDVMQDTVVNAFNGVRFFDQRSTFSTWLTRIAINNALLLLRRRKNNKEISFDETDGSPLQVADHRISPEQALIRNQSIENIRRIVQALPSALRDYVEQRYLEELPHSEAASSLGISLSAGKSRSLRARQRLQSLLVSRRRRPTLTLHVTKHTGEGTVSARMSATSGFESVATSWQ